MKPEFDISGSHLSLIPDNIKVKKSIKLRPLPFDVSGTVIWHLETNDVRYKLSCKDSLLKGKVHVDLEGKAIEYRKHFSLPVAGLRLASFVLGARCKYIPEEHRFKPSYHVGFSFKQGSAEIVQLNTIRARPHLFFRNIGIEAVTDISFSVPKQLLFEFARGGADQDREQCDNDAWGVKLDIQEMNLILRL